MQQLDAVSVPVVEVGSEYEISIPMISPIETGSYQSQWRIYTANDWSFGGRHCLSLQLTNSRFYFFYSKRGQIIRRWECYFPRSELIQLHLYIAPAL